MTSATLARAEPRCSIKTMLSSTVAGNGISQNRKQSWNTYFRIVRIPKQRTKASIHQLTNPKITAARGRSGEVASRRAALLEIKSAPAIKPEPIANAGLPVF